MSWLALSYASAAISSVWNISVKEGTMKEDSDIYALQYSIVTFLIFLILFLWKAKTYFSVNIFTIIAGIFQGVAIIYLTKSLDESANPGLVMSVFRTQAILTTILAVFLLNANLSFDKIIAMIFVIGGVYLATSKNKKSNNTSNNWIVAALVAAVSMSIKDICLKKTLLKNTDVINIIFYSFLTQIIILYFYTSVVKKKKIEFKKTTWKTSVLSGSSFAAYIMLLTLASKLAPNVGYVKAIDTMGVLLTIIASRYMFDAPVSKENMIGVLIIIASVGYISIKKA